MQSRIYDMNNLMRQLVDVGDGGVGNPNLKNSNYVPNLGSRLNFDMGGNNTPGGNMNAMFGAPKQTSSLLNMQQQFLNSNQHPGPTYQRQPSMLGLQQNSQLFT